MICNHDYCYGLKVISIKHHYFLICKFNRLFYGPFCKQWPRFFLKLSSETDFFRRPSGIFYDSNSSCSVLFSVCLNVCIANGLTPLPTCHLHMKNSQTSFSSYTSTSVLNFGMVFLNSNISCTVFNWMSFSISILASMQLSLPPLSCHTHHWETLLQHKAKNSCLAGMAQ